MRILDALITSLGLDRADADYVCSLHSGHNNQLRMAHYPVVPVEEVNKELVSRLPAHTDWRYF